MTGRILLGLALAVFLGVWVWAWAVLPADGVVLQIRGPGAHRTGSRGGLLWPMLLLGPALVLALRWLVVRTARRSPEMISYPHRDYWLAPERREEGIRRMTAELDVLLAATLLLLTAGLAEAVRHTLDLGAFFALPAALGGYLVFFLGWAAWLWRRSRPPAAGHREAAGA